MSEWIPSESHPEYIEKNTTLGTAKIVILRPKLSEAEAAKAQERARAALENAMHERCITTNRKEEAQWAKT
jgi:hypothetical protein